MSTDTRVLDSTLLERLQAYMENDLTTNILVPLLRKLGWGKVEFSGGVYEGGKDIICWKKDEIDTTILGVAQVKKYKPTGRAADERSFSALATQLCQAKEMPVPNLEEGINYKPTIIYCITPYEIDIKALQTRFEKIEELKTRQVKVIDGSKLVRLIKTKAPELIDEIIGIGSSIDGVIGRELTNEVLLKVLNIKEAVDISKFYCDLDLVVGNVSTKFLFMNKAISISSKISIHEIEWQKLLSIEKECKCYSFSLIKENPDEVNKIYDQQILEYETRKRNLDNCYSLFSDLYLEITHLLGEVAIGKDVIKILSEKILMPLSPLDQSHSQKSVEKFKAGFEDFIARIALVLDKTPSEEKKLIIDVMCNAYIEEAEDDIDGLIFEVKKAQERVKEPKITINVTGEHFVEYLSQLKQWIKLSTEKINEQKVDQERISSFLKECNKRFKVFVRVFKSDFFNYILEFEPENDTKNNSKISIGIDKIIDSRKDLIIYGEAGAGKTTSLQMYAKKIISSKNDNNISIYVPLTKLSQFVLNIKSANISGSKVFYAAYSLYLKNEGINLSAEDVSKFLKSKDRVTILADGLDEIVKNNDWIIKSLFDVKDENINVQLIVTSRPYEDQDFNRDFYEISLLPFDDNKQSEFIENWLKSRNRYELVDGILDHLDQCPDVKEITRTPLLATILCILAMNNIPLPQSEVRLYSERLRLLFGDYDVAKGAYRIDSQREDLYLVARKIAYQLHCRQSRAKSRQEIIIDLENSLKLMAKDKIELAVDELIYPCNILIPMASNEDLGFGHLRYQEHLVATELNMNRGIDIGPLLYNPWWRGSLSLYSKMCDGIDHLFEWVTMNSSFRACSGNLRAMIDARGEEDRQILGPMLDSNVYADNIMDLD